MAPVEALHHDGGQSVRLTAQYEHLYGEHGLLDAPFLEVRENAKKNPIRVILHGPGLVRHLLQTTLRQLLGHSVLATGLGELRDEGGHLGFVHPLALPQALQIVDHQRGLFPSEFESKGTCIRQKHGHSGHLLDNVSVLLRHPRRHLFQTHFVLHNHNLVRLPVSRCRSRLLVIDNKEEDKSEGKNTV